MIPLFGEAKTISQSENPFEAQKPGFVRIAGAKGSAPGRSAATWVL